MEHSKLENHKFKKGQFITPWNNMLGSKGVMKNWALERLPEYVWIGLIFEKYGRNSGLEKCYMIIKKLHELQPEINSPTMSNILFLENSKQQDFWNYVTKYIDISVLAPQTMVYSYRQYKVFNKIFQYSSSYSNDVNKICEVLIKGFDGHSSFATD